MLCVHTEESWEGFKICPLLLTCRPPKPATEKGALQRASWTTKGATQRALLEELESMFGTMYRTRQNRAKPHAASHSMVHIIEHSLHISTYSCVQKPEQQQTLTRAIVLFLQLPHNKI